MLDTLVKIEYKLLLGETISIEQLREDMINNCNEDYEENNDTILESNINDVLNKCKQLYELYGSEVYDYNEYNRSIRLKNSFLAINEYSLCIHLLKDGGKIDDKTRNIYSLFFEDIVGESLKVYLGKNSQCIKVDSKEEIDIEKICQEILFESYRPDATKKFNINMKNLTRTDLLLFKHLDNRSGKIIIFVQCSSGNNWNNKESVNIDAWTSSFIDLSVKPLKVYAITDLIDDNEILMNRQTEKGLIFDRARIIRQLASQSTHELVELRNKISTFNINKNIRL